MIDAYEDGLLEKADFESRVRHARERLARLQKEVTTVTDFAVDRKELRLVLGHLEDFAGQVRHGLDQADFNSRREIIRSLVKVVKIEEQHIRIIYTIAPRPFADAPSLGGHFRQHCYYHAPGRKGYEPAAIWEKYDDLTFSSGPTWIPHRRTCFLTSMSPTTTCLRYGRAARPYRAEPVQRKLGRHRKERTGPAQHVVGEPHAGLKELAGLKNLQALSLYGTQVTRRAHGTANGTTGVLDQLV